MLSQIFRRIWQRSVSFEFVVVKQTSLHYVVKLGRFVCLSFPIEYIRFEFLSPPLEYIKFVCLSLPLEGIVQSFICLDKYLGVFIWVNNTSVPTQNMYFTPTFMNIFRTKEVPVSFDFWLDIHELFMLGSKVLGFYVFRTLICIVGKP